MAEDEFERIATALGMTVADLREIALDLFAAWLGGATRYPTLSQQNQEWYRAVLAAAGKSNPTRDDLKNWFGLPHGTAQYLAGVLYDPRAEKNQEHVEVITQAVLAGIRRSSDDAGKLGKNVVTVFLTPAVARTLESLLVEALGKDAQEPPTLTRLTGTVKVSFSKNQGFESLCEALGPSGAKVREAVES